MTPGKAMMTGNKKAKRIVIKCGSSLVSTDAGGVDNDYITRLSKVIAQVKEAGVEVVLVSSGAIACGFRLLGYKTRPKDIPSLQACAAVGQAALIDSYAQHFRPYKIPVGQVLLTLNDTSSRIAYLHAKNTFARLLELGALAVVNENDTVAVNEIKFGDNDALAAITAAICEADLVVIFSDVDGLYTANPHTNPDAKRLDTIDEITPEIFEMAGESISGVGTGGMASKLKAAGLVMQAGIDTIICEGKDPEVLVDIVNGKQVGSRFVAHFDHLVNSRKLWISVANKMSGRVYIDEGAERALRQKGSSLLAVGVKDFIGTFSAGDALMILNEHDELVARGLSRYSSEELSVVKGMNMDMISRVYPKLAHQPFIHRDELVVY